MLLTKFVCLRGGTTKIRFRPLRHDHYIQRPYVCDSFTRPLYPWSLMSAKGSPIESNLSLFRRRSLDISPSDETLYLIDVNQSSQVSQIWFTSLDSRPFEGRALLEHIRALDYLGWDCHVVTCLLKSFDFQPSGLRADEQLLPTRVKLDARLFVGKRQTESSERHIVYLNEFIWSHRSTGVDLTPTADNSYCTFRASKSMTCRITSKAAEDALLVARV